MLKNRMTWVCLITASVCELATSAAQTYTIRAFSIDCGGGFSRQAPGGGLAVTGTIGQASVLDGAMTGGGFALHGGFIPAFAILHSPPCPADLNGDGLVDLSDLTIILSDYGCADPSACVADLDRDGDTDLGDLTALLSSFGTNCP
jgi:hypothetical protein